MALMLMERVMIALDDENYGIISLALIDAPTKRKRSAEEVQILYSSANFFSLTESQSSLSVAYPTHKNNTKYLTRLPYPPTERDPK